MDRQTTPFWRVSAVQVLKDLQTAPSGLSAAEAASRLERYSACRLAPKKRTDTVTLLLGQFSSPIVLLLLGATAISLFLHDTTDAAIILAIVLASGLLGFWQERGAAGAVDKLLSLVEVKAQVLGMAPPTRFRWPTWSRATWSVFRPAPRPRATACSSRPATSLRTKPP
jgi:P-type Mg2+ transporter